MSQTINTNLASMNAQRNTSTSQNSLATAMQRGAAVGKGEATAANPHHATVSEGS